MLLLTVYVLKPTEMCFQGRTNKGSPKVLLSEDPYEHLIQAGIWDLQLSERPWRWSRVQTGPRQEHHQDPCAPPEVETRLRVCWTLMVHVEKVHRHLWAGPDGNRDNSIVIEGLREELMMSPAQVAAPAPVLSHVTRQCRLHRLLLSPVDEGGPCR